MFSYVCTCIYSQYECALLSPEIMGQLNDEGVKKQIENTFKKYATSASGRMLFGSVKDALQRLQINLEKSQYEKNIASSWVLANK